MQLVLKHMRKHLLGYCIATLAMLAAIALDMLNPLLVRVIIDDIIKAGHVELLTRTLLALLGVTLGRGILGYLREFLFDKTGSSVAMDLRKEVFHHVNSLSLSFFDTRNTGELMARIKEDVDNIWDSCGFCIRFLIDQIVYFVMSAVILFILSWKLALLCLAVMPLIFLLAMIMERKLDKIYDKISDQAAVLNTTAQENIAGVRLIRSFAREPSEIEKFRKQNEENYNLNYQETHILSKYDPAIEFLCSVVTVFIITAGGILVIGKDLTLGTLVAVNSFAAMMTGPVRNLSWIANVIARASASLKKINAIMAEKPEIQPPDNPQIPPVIQGAVSFSHVSFSRDSKTILDDISFTLPAGGTLAIMGFTGAGKSSIINLLCRFYDVTGGAISLDSIDVRNWDLTALRRSIAVVMQDVFLFSDTVEENIYFGDDTDLESQHSVSKETMLQASLDAQVHAFAQGLSEGYETIIGERGIGLSGGQKQRISIARALAKDYCKVLILDDATSALDMETEHAIQEAIDKRKDVTKILIAHRISAVKDADEILFLDKGRIAERGTHDVLMAKKGLYYETYLEQYGAQYGATTA
ncbi:MAG: ABC transporter ATP-binding protein [Bianqueaceae bacterium]